MVDPGDVFDRVDDGKDRVVVRLRPPKAPTHAWMTVDGHGDGAPVALAELEKAQAWVATGRKEAVVVRPDDIPPAVDIKGR
jgi:hypothetical protein